MTTAISNMSAQRAGTRRKQQKSSSLSSSSPPPVAVEADAESLSSAAASADAQQQVALDRHVSLNTTALVLAMGSVCIPIYTKQRRGARHLTSWIAKTGAVAIGLHLLQVNQLLVFSGLLSGP